MSTQKTPQLYGVNISLTQDEMDQFNSKDLPKKHKLAPVFNMDKPEGIAEWIEEVQNILAVGTTSDAVKVAKALEWMTKKTRDNFKDLESVKNPNFEKFIEALKGVYTESISSEKGSRQRLYEIIQQFMGLRLGETERLRVYNQMFKTEVNLLMQPPPIISNRDAISLYVSPMTSSLQESIQNRLQITMKNVDLTQRRREDPYDLKDVIEAAESLEVGLGFQTVYSTASSGPSMGRAVPPGAESFNRGSLALPFVAQLPRSTPNYMQNVKAEPVESQNELAAGIAQIKDTIELQNKQITTTLKGHDTSIGQLFEIVKASHATPQKVGYTTSQLTTFPTNNNRPYNNSGSYNMGSYGGNGTRPLMGKDLCLLCESPEHRIAACPHLREFKERGWLVPESETSNRVMLKDGSPLPRFDPNEKRHEKVIKIAKEKGWDQSKAFFVEYEDEELLVEEEGPQYAALLSQVTAALEQHNMRAKKWEENLKSDNSKN